MKTLVTIRSRDLVNQIFNESAYEKLKSIGELTFIHDDLEYFESNYEKIIGDYDFCVTGWGSRKFTDDILDISKNLKLIGHTAGTVIPIVDRSVFDRGIKVVNANSYLAKSTAEFAVVMMMAGAWNLNEQNVNMKNDIWSDSENQSFLGVAGRTIGIIGYGEISQEVIRLLQSFEVEILLYSSYCPEEEAKRLGITLVGLDELLKRSDIVSLHNTLTEQSRGMLGKRELSLMRDGSLLVNTARQPIIDNDALLAEMKSGRLLGAIDVYEAEPIPKDHPLLSCKNVFCAPHIGGFGKRWKSRLAELVADNILLFLDGKELKNEVGVGLFDRQSPR